MKDLLQEYKEHWDKIFILQCEEISMGVDNKRKIEKIVKKLRKNSHKVSFDDIAPIKRDD